MLQSLASHHPRYTVACALGVLTSLLLLASHHGPPAGMHDAFGLLPGRPHPPAGPGLKAKLDEAEKDYSINVARRHAFMRKAGTNPQAIEAYVAAAYTDRAMSSYLTIFAFSSWPALGHEPHMYTLCMFPSLAGGFP